MKKIRAICDIQAEDVELKTGTILEIVIRQDDKRKENQGCKECVQKQYRNNGIVAQRLFLEGIIES